MINYTNRLGRASIHRENPAKLNTGSRLVDSKLMPKVKDLSLMMGLEDLG
jgi:hypothetical protein